MKNRNENILNKSKLGQPFKVPNGYFEEFSTKVQHAIIEEEKNDTPFNRLIALFNTRFAITFAITTLLVVFILSVSYPTSTVISISDEEAYSYLFETNIEEIDEYLIAEYIEEDYPETTFTPSEEEILDYLMNEDIEESIFY